MATDFQRQLYVQVRRESCLVSTPRFVHIQVRAIFVPNSSLHCTSLLTKTLCFCQRSCAATAFRHWLRPLRLACRNRPIWSTSLCCSRSTAVEPVADAVIARATSTNTLDCFKRAPKTFPSWLTLQIISPPRNSSEWGYSKVYSLYSNKYRRWQKQSGICAHESLVSVPRISQ